MLLQQLVLVVEEELMPIVKPNPRGSTDLIDIDAPSGSRCLYCSTRLRFVSGLTTLLYRAF